ncbi:GNAT family N-acetyltransferase [Bacillus sp. JJ63]|uniref:GNAT family N-acetyltransferase n=1 Tax=Bacillus sp. JJ63 TaxID=3122968 RepID=UPI003000D946
MRTGMNFGREQFGIHTVSLAVAAFNERAVKVYKKVGFVPVQTLLQQTIGSEYEFVEMISK